MAEEYYAISITPNNIDFYIGSQLASSTIFATSSVQVASYKIASAACSISSSVNITATASKIAFTQSSAAGSLTITKQPIKILHVLLYSDSHLTIATSASKTTFPTSNISIQLSTSFNPHAVRHSHVTVHSQSSIDVSATKIAQTGAISSNASLSASVTPSEILFGVVAIAIGSSAVINPPVRFSPGYIDSSNLKTLLILDGKPLTNHGRELDISLENVFVENKNWQNTKTRYYKRSSSAGRKTFNISWRFLPNARNKTVDNQYSRDYILEITEDPDLHILKIVNHDEDGLTPYTETSHNVFVKSYSETLLRRDIADGVYYFDCTLVLEEA